MSTSPNDSPAEPSPEASFPVQTRPGFDAAVRHSTFAPLALLDEDPRFLRSMSDIPTYALGILALHLHANDRLYHRGLQEAAKNLFSAGRASAILARMQTAGLIEPLDDFKRGKQRRYTPAPAMLHAFRAFYFIELQSLAMIDPRAQAMVEAYDDPSVFDGLVTTIAARHLTAPVLDQDLIEPMGGAGRRSMGVMLTYSLAETAYKADLSHPQGMIDINVSALARRLGVSRPHAQRILSLLREAGLVTDGDRDGRLILLPAFAEAHALYFGGMYTMLLEAVDRYTAAQSSSRDFRRRVSTLPHAPFLSSNLTSAKRR